jgi:hypothetical protein
VNYRNASSGGIEATDFSTSLKQYQSHHLELQLFHDKVLPVQRDMLETIGSLSLP